MIVLHWRPNNGQRTAIAGFTLLEVLTAITIIAIVMVSIYRLHSQTLLMTQRGRFYALAPRLAALKAEEIASADQGFESASSGAFGEDFPGYAWEAVREPISSEILGEQSEALQRISVTVTAPGAELSYTLTTCRLFALQGATP